MILKKYRIIFILFLFYSKVFGCSFQEVIDDIVIRYTRPLTFLYITDKPIELNIKSNDVLILLSKKKEFLEVIKRNNLNNIVFLYCNYTQNELKKLADCEHFDICIFQDGIELEEVNDVHLADITIVLTENKDDLVLPDLICDEGFVYVYNNPKILLKRNWWNSISSHKNYNIYSTFDEKYILKPKEYSQKGEAVINSWMPGINLYTYINLGGIYPSKKYVRDRVIEVFDPLTHFDFGAANIIIQGKILKAIDYDDTKYSEDPYLRLERTLTKQLGIEYKSEM